MNGQFFISLLNPGIGLSFAVAFFLLWLNRRERYVAYAAGAYTASAIAFLIQDVGPVLPMELQRLPANIGFLATGILFAAAPDWSLERAAMEMSKRHIRHLVVVDSGELVGILSMRDIVRVWTTEGATSAMTPPETEASAA